MAGKNYLQAGYDSRDKPPVTTSDTNTDTDAPRRSSWYLTTMSMWTALGVLEVALSLRFLLKLLGANPATGFSQLIYGVTWLFTLPFAGLFPNWVNDQMIFEGTTLVAIGVYWLFAWIAIRALRKYAAAG